MNEIITFNNQQFGEIRTVELNGEPWFVAADVCKALDVANTTQALSRLDEDERSMFNIGRQGETGIVNEYGLYSLVLGSRKPEAKAFKRWITHDVIPSIRKHGGYLTQDKLEEVLADPDTLIRLATDLKEERKKRRALEMETERQKQLIADFEPSRQYIDEILQSKGTMKTSQIAADYDLSARALNKILHEEGVQRNVGGQWILYKQHMGKGYTKSETFQFRHENGRMDSKMQTVWTQKGRLMIHEILTQRGVVAVMDRKQTA